MFGKKKQSPRQKEVARYFTCDADEQLEIRKQAWEDWEKICQEFPDVSEADTGLNCSLNWGHIHWDNTDMPVSEYRIALERQLARLKQGMRIIGYDDTTIGDKNTECTGGMCWEGEELWGGRLAMRFMPAEGPHNGKQRARYRPLACPLDRRDNPSRWGCFYHCRFFNPEKEAKRITTPEAIPLYEAALARLDEDTKPDAE